MNKTLVFLTFFLQTTSFSFAQEVKKADLAGAWYPSDAATLSSMLDGYLNEADPENIPPDIVALIVPHAGYVYSGPVAAYAFKAISDMDVDTIVIVGISHRRYYDAISVYNRGAVETPLGLLQVDSGLAREIILRDDKIYFNPEAFKNENSVEMMYPFIRHVFKGRNVKIVPIAMGVQSYKNAEILADALYEALKGRERILIIASTDMSHFHNYGEANAIDGIAIETLKRFDPKELYDKAEFKKCELCGTGAVVATMMAAKRLGADSIEVLKYANSGDTVGQKNSVVGYISAAMYRSGPPGPLAAGHKRGEEAMFNDAQRERLLQIARESLETYIRTGEKLEVKEDDPDLNRNMGAFVTLNKAGRLRGCIGSIIGQGPLYLTVRDKAIDAAVNDPRFRDVTVDELAEIHIEISALSELKKIEDPDEIVLGKHGVLIQSGFSGGVYLPQVATETGWTKEEFMSSLCSHKAGLPPDAWKTGNVNIQVFTAEVFGE